MGSMRNSIRARRGQALLLVTLSLFAMCGLLGLAVDLGWSYFVKKSAQNAADSAALAEAYQALAQGGETGTSFAGDSATALWYAKQNLFEPGGNRGRQNVTVTAGAVQLTRQDGSTVPSCATNPTLIGCVDYWVTVRTAETIPQLFSAVLGNTTGLSSARASAAIVRARVNGSIVTLNRASDLPPPGFAGISQRAQSVANSQRFGRSGCSLCHFPQRVGGCVKWCRSPQRRGQLRLSKPGRRATISRSSPRLRTTTSAQRDAQYLRCHRGQHERQHWRSVPIYRKLKCRQYYSADCYGRHGDPSRGQLRARSLRPRVCYGWYLSSKLGRTHTQYQQPGYLQRRIPVRLLFLLRRSERRRWRKNDHGSR